MKEKAITFELTFEDRLDHLYAHIRGDISQTNDKIDCWHEIIRTTRDLDKDKLLVVLDGKGNATELDAYECTRRLIDLDISGIRFAYVDLDVDNHAVNLFGELTASNRGADAKVFTNEGDALSWLTSSGLQLHSWQQSPAI